MNVVQIIRDLLVAIPHYTDETRPAIKAGMEYVRQYGVLPAPVYGNDGCGGKDCNPSFGEPCKNCAPDVATPMPKVFIPHGENNIDGVNWLLFYNEGTFDAFKAMPTGLEYKGRKYGKMGWNSDTHTVHYKEIPLAIAC